jgi:hypothetical protein
MNKKELLVKLLEAQKAGKLADKAIIPKVEAADERVIEQWSNKLKKAK